MVGSAWTEDIVRLAAGGGGDVVAAAARLSSRDEVRPHDRAFLVAELSGYSPAVELPVARAVWNPIVLDTRIRTSLEPWPAIDTQRLEGVRSPLDRLASASDSHRPLQEPLSPTEFAVMKQWLRAGRSRPVGAHGLELVRAHKVVAPSTSFSIVRATQHAVLRIVDDCRSFEESVAAVHDLQTGLTSEQLDELELRLRRARATSGSRPGAMLTRVLLDGMADAAGTVLVAALKSIVVSLIGGAAVFWTA